MNTIKGLLDVFTTKSAIRGFTGALGTPLPWFPTTKAFRETCGHFIDLPSDADLENTLCEVHYIHHTLRHYLLPTTLPDDNLELCSRLLRSLETRRDLTPLVLSETSIVDTIFGIARLRYPPPDESPGLQSRVMALRNHWRSSSTKATPLTTGYAVSSKPPLVPEDYELSLTLEQAADAELHYRLWRTNRDRKVSYLKRHPPEPVRAQEVTRREITLDVVWEALPWMPDEMKKAPEDRQIKLEPLYQQMDSQAVPLDWVNPDGSLQAFATPGEERRWEEIRRKMFERKDRQARYANELMGNKKRQL
ncbi:hypothetical protein N0V84_001863 [Fusarium piperis]|uniref:Uncharacterized protein n=1 Tax=Fusarium piperis TaxID=1435070 RepID=A0A9W9BTY5_9HYPO|nr:hypothetical protein N0V84_001863 [Fusarium piperis]